MGSIWHLGRWPSRWRGRRGGEAAGARVTVQSRGGLELTWVRDRNVLEAPHAVGGEAAIRVVGVIGPAGAKLMNAGGIAIASPGPTRGAVSVLARGVTSALALGCNRRQRFANRAVGGILGRLCHETLHVGHVPAIAARGCQPCQKQRSPEHMHRGCTCLHFRRDPDDQGKGRLGRPVLSELEHDRQLLARVLVASPFLGTS